MHGMYFETHFKWKLNTKCIKQMFTVIIMLSSHKCWFSEMQFIMIKTQQAWVTYCGDDIQRSRGVVTHKNIYGKKEKLINSKSISKNIIFILILNWITHIFIGMIFCRRLSASDKCSTMDKFCILINFASYFGSILVTFSIIFIQNIYSWDHLQFYNEHRFFHFHVVTLAIGIHYPSLCTCPDQTSTKMPIECLFMDQYWQFKAL